MVLRAIDVEVNNDRGVNRIMAEETEEEFREFWRRSENRDLVGRDKILTAFCPQVISIRTIENFNSLIKTI